MEFVHLHNYSQYSFYESIIRCGWYHLCKKNNFSSIALTDCNHLYGIVKFHKTCIKHHIKPIIGQVFNIRPIINSNVSERTYKILLIASTDSGFENLVKLSSFSWELDNTLPYIQLDHLESYNKGLICLTSGLGSEVSYYIIQGHLNEAEKSAGILRNLFPKDHFYLELQDHGLACEREMNRGLLSLSEKLDIPVVATNMCRYLYKEDFKIFLTLQKLKNPTVDISNFPNEFYVKSAEEMAELFKDTPDAISNTIKISYMIDFNLNGYYSDMFRTSKFISQQDENKEDIDNDDILVKYARECIFVEGELKKRALEGAHRRYGNNIPDEIIFNLQKELALLNLAGGLKNILMLHEIIQKYKENHYIIVPGRGANASSVLFYCLGINVIDPAAHGLISERYININNLKYFDTIFLSIGTRGYKEFYNCAIQKYGEDFITSIPSVKKVDDDKNFTSILSDMKITDELLCKIEFLPCSFNFRPRGFYFHNNTGIPTLRIEKWNWNICQIDPVNISGFNNILIDVEYLNELSMIENCIRIINEISPVFTVNQIPMDDEKTIQIFKAGNTEDIFQFDEPAVIKLLLRLNPENFNDLHALISLNRPGPINGGLLEKFILHRHNPDTITYPHNSIRKYLEDTRGIMIYQEQFMHITHEICRLSLPEADSFRKAGGKKISDHVDYYEMVCIQNMVSNGIKKDEAIKIIQWMLHYIEFFFHKAHAVGYTMISWWMAYLKTHYPVEFNKAREDINKFR